MHVSHKWAHCNSSKTMELWQYNSASHHSLVSSIQHTKFLCTIHSMQCFHSRKL